jgi:hypothetical protein
MLQADVLPNMGFSATRKRLVHTYECVKDEDSEELEMELLVDGESKKDEL